MRDLVPQTISWSAATRVQEKERRKESRGEGGGGCDISGEGWQENKSLAVVSRLPDAPLCDALLYNFTLIAVETRQFSSFSSPYLFHAPPPYDCFFRTSLFHPQPYPPLSLSLFLPLSLSLCLTLSFTFLFNLFLPKASRLYFLPGTLRPSSSHLVRYLTTSGSSVSPARVGWGGGGGDETGLREPSFRS